MTDCTANYLKNAHILMLLCLMILPVRDSFAIEPGASVYVQEMDEGDWTPAKYVAARSDCLLLERLRPNPRKASFLRVHSQIIEEKIEVGREVQELRPGQLRPDSKMSQLVDRVLSVGMSCHEVTYASGPDKLYVLPENIFEYSEFMKLRDSKTEISVGDKVYALEVRVSPERWSLRTVIAKRADCYEIESGEKVLCGNYLEDEYLYDSAPLFTIPAKITKIIKKGDSLDDYSKRFFLEGSPKEAAYSTLEGTVVNKTNDTLIIKSSNEDCSWEPFSVADIRRVPPPLSMKGFADLRPGDVVLERVDPACCCCSPYYTPHKIKSQKGSGYLLIKIGGGEVEARSPSQLITAKALERR